MPSTVLIVDDTSENVGPLAEHLAQHGYRVVVAQDGEEGIKRARFVRPDLMLLDVMMPAMDGFETCRRLKASEETAPIPVIFMTALDDLTDKLIGFQCGAVDYVTKPLQIEEVMARVATHVALREAQASLAQARDELEVRVAQRTADLRERESRIRRLVESNVIGVFFWNVGGDVTEANDEFLRILGYSRADLIAGKIRWKDLTPPEWHATTDNALQQLQSKGASIPFEKEYWRKDGTRAPVLLGSALFEGSRTEGVAFVLDLSARKRAESRIRYMAHHDALTGLPNRVLLEDRLVQAIAQARRESRGIAMLAIGLDHFKYVNESLGHPVGDQILREAGRRLQRCLREGDTVARVGGDQFAVLLGNTGGNDAAAIASKVLESFDRAFQGAGQALRITASVGIALHPTDADDASGLLRAADVAMHTAKEQGRNTYQYFDAEQNVASRQRVQIAAALHNALARHEFVLHYQPQLDLRTGAVNSAEALLRWKRDGQLLSCGDFIAIAEETGLIGPIGEWVLREACHQARLWHDAGHKHLHVAVNVSPRQLRQPGFPAFVERTLERSALPAAALEIEITETLLMQQTRDNIETLTRLMQMGVRISIDDFGVGYSNLGYLRRFPIHSVKIDRSFVNDVVTDANDRAIVRTIIAMAKSLGVRVVAEGVETEEQAAFLREHDCDAAQGFLYGKPAPPEALIAPAYARP